MLDLGFLARLNGTEISQDEGIIVVCLIDCIGIWTSLSTSSVVVRVREREREREQEQQRDESGERDTESYNSKAFI